MTAFDAAAFWLAHPWLRLPDIQAFVRDALAKGQRVLGLDGKPVSP